MSKEILHLLELQGSLITDVPLEIPFTVDDPSMLPEGIVMDKIIVNLLKVGTVFRINPLIAKIDNEDLKKVTVSRDQKYDASIQEVFEKYSEVVLEIICMGIHNKNTPYPDYLKDFLRENCTWEDLHIILNAVLFRMGALSFLDSTTEIAKVGLQSAEEIIALQQNLESWQSHSAPTRSSRSQQKPSGGAPHIRSGKSASRP